MAVSYTHLDVYKRQIFQNGLNTHTKFVSGKIFDTFLSKRLSSSETFIIYGVYNSVYCYLNSGKSIFINVALILMFFTQTRLNNKNS